MMMMMMIMNTYLMSKGIINGCDQVYIYGYTTCRYIYTRGSCQEEALSINAAWIYKLQYLRVFRP
jgi:hypothetical protein